MNTNDEAPLRSFEEFLRYHHWTIRERCPAYQEPPPAYAYLYYVVRPIGKQGEETEEASYWVTLHPNQLEVLWVCERIPPRPPFHMPSKHRAPWGMDATDLTTPRPVA